MIDLRAVEPLEPAHLNLDPEKHEFHFLCREMKIIRDNLYQCADLSCKLVYNKFCFIGYYKNPDLPFPGITYPDNILDKAMVCKPRCAILKLSDQTGFYKCPACGGNFMKHPEFGIISVLSDWFAQDIRVLKFLIQFTQKESKLIREHAANYPNSEKVKAVLKRLEKAEKFLI